MRLNLRRLPVLKRIIPSFRRSLRKAVNAEPYAIYHYLGVRMLLNPENFTDRQIAYFRDCESRQIDALTRHLAAFGCDLFLDIGAHKGLYSLIVNHRRLAHRIAAFEPDVRNWRNLQANLLLNGVGDRIAVYAKAAAARSGTVAFHYGAADKTGRSRVVPADSGPTLEAVALDDLFDDRGQRLAAKIDVEGYQIEVLRGMEALLAGNRCFLQIEADDTASADLIAYMTKRGFQYKGRIDIDHYFDNLPEPTGGCSPDDKTTPAVG